MVKSDYSGELYTIEGLVAGLLMLATAFIVVGSVNIYTPGDAHISDMQLQQLGSDALLMLDTPENDEDLSTLKYLAEEVSKGGSYANNARRDFYTAFEKELERGTGSSVLVDSIRYNATVYYRDTGSNTIQSFDLGDSGWYTTPPDNKGSEISRQPAISTGRLVLVKDQWGNDKVYRVEVRLWRA